MTTTLPQKNPVKKWLHLAFGLCLLIAFFLPWVLWQDYTIKGVDFPTGKFFEVSSSKFALANPFPALRFTFLIFLCIPVCCCLSIYFTFIHKKNHWPALAAGVLSLTLVTVYYLFSTVLVDLGVGHTAMQMLQWPAFLVLISSIGIISTLTLPKYGWQKISWIFIGPVLAFVSFKLIEQKVMNATHQTTDNLTADYTISATQMLQEFAQSDSLANTRYREKIIIVNGRASQVEKKTDSTSNIRFDGADGSFIVFSLDKGQYAKVKNIQPGDSVSLKGSCSGSIHSEILGTTSISFQRSTIH